MKTSKNRKIAVYADTSVYGNVFDADFSEASSTFLNLVKSDKYFGVFLHLNASNEFVQISIEGKQAVFSGSSLGAENTINDIQAMFRT
jgi:hypothetical protein